MPVVIDDNNFGNQYWNLIQVLAWIYSKTFDVSNDDALIKIREEALRRETPTSSEIEKSTTNNDRLYAGGITWVDPDYDERLGSILNEQLNEQLKAKIGDPNWFDDIEKELTDALRSNELKCSGINNNSGNREEITAMDWLDLKFYYGIATFQAGSENYGSGTKWNGLKLSAESVKKVWLTPPVESTVKDEVACQNWLEGLMNSSSTQDKAKKLYQDEATQKYSLGTKAFNRAWANAKTATGNTNWGKPGRRKS